MLPDKQHREAAAAGLLSDGCNCSAAAAAALLPGCFVMRHAVLQLRARVMINKQ